MRCGRCKRNLHPVDMGWDEAYCLHCERPRKYKWYRAHKDEVYVRKQALRAKRAQVKKLFGRCNCGRVLGRDSWSLVPTTGKGDAIGLDYELDCDTLRENYKALCKACNLYRLENEWQRT